ncbi:MAG: glycerophosphoryl diester phosphodiesterase membrane domain-containing protein [Candidatus Diapherotrites archaeon]
MIDTLLNSFKILLKKPAMPILAILGGALSMGLLMLLGQPIGEMIADILFFGILPETGALAFPIHFIEMYPFGFGAVFAMIASLFIISTLLSFFFSKYIRDTAEKKASKGMAFGYMLGNIVKIIGLLLFFTFAWGVLLFILWIMMIISLGPYALVGIIMLIYMLLLAYLWIKLSFVIPVMAMENISIREALKKSWAFTGKNLLGVLTLFVFIMIVTALINNIGLSMFNLIYVNEYVDALIFAIFSGLASAYTYAAFPMYYLKKEHNMEP